MNDSPRTLAGSALLVLCMVFGPASAAAQDAPADARRTPGFTLTVDEIMRGPELVGEEPDDVRWSEDGRWILFEWKPGGRPWYEPPSVWRYDARAARLEELSERAADSLGVHLAEGALSPDRRREVVSHEGDLFLVDRRTLEVRRLTRTAAAERSPVFGARGERIYFVRDDNVFTFELEGGAVRQLTNIRTGDPEEEQEQEEELEGQRGFLAEQQAELFESIRVQQRLEARRDSLRELEEAEDLTELWIPEEERVLSLSVDPAGQFVAVEVGRPDSDEQVAIVPDWVTESGYTEVIETRTKVGDEEGETRLALIDVAGETLEWVDLSPGVEEADTTAGEERFASIAFLGWNEQGTRGLVAAVSYDWNDQWLHALDARTGELTLIAHDHDDAWIGGPCSAWAFGCAGWLPGGDAAWLISERSGYSHLYRVPATGGEARALTSGAWEVLSASVAPDESRFYLTTSEVSPFEVHFYEMDLGGGERTRLTHEPGAHSVTVSPDGELLADVFSYANRPPDLYVMENEAGAEPRRVTTSPTDEWLSHDWIRPEIVRVPARDGTPVPARIYRPADVGAQPNGGAVVFVHGAGYLHNVHDWWSSYYREYMFHHLLAERGYTVLDLDYRGSAGYGRDWRTAIYRHMGGLDLTDNVDGARWLVEQGYATGPERVGIYGGSYGGFITLMALFTEAASFGAGAALRSVTDWAHYNHGYTGRILN
ncbi:MAG: DPP IV N-terminal domain-containing protein, partial [Longimicrobiales bacterium]